MKSTNSKRPLSPVWGLIISGKIPTFNHDPGGWLGFAENGILGFEGYATPSSLLLLCGIATSYLIMRCNELLSVCSAAFESMSDILEERDRQDKAVPVPGAVDEVSTDLLNLSMEDPDNTGEKKDGSESVTEAKQSTSAKEVTTGTATESASLDPKYDGVVLPGMTKSRRKRVKYRHRKRLAGKSNGNAKLALPAAKVTPPDSMEQGDGDGASNARGKKRPLNSPTEPDKTKRVKQSYLQAASKSLQIAVITKNDPDGKLTTDHVKVVRKAISDAMLAAIEAGVQEPPHCERSGLIDGRVIVSCSNQYSYDWFMETLKAVGSANGTELDVLNKSEIPGRIWAGIHIPDNDLDVEKTLKILQWQNSGLVTSKWTRITPKKVPPKGNYLFWIDPVSAGVMKQSNFLLHYQATRAKCWIKEPAAAAPGPGGEQDKGEGDH